MGWEPWVEQAVNRGGFWLVHLNYVAFWVLLSLASALLLVRIILLHANAWRLGATGASWRLWLPTSAGLLVAALGAGYLAVRPDPQFYTTVGDEAFERGDCARAITYYRPLADWGSHSPELHLRLASCLLRVGRVRAAAACAERAIALGTESAAAHAVAGLAYAAAGDAARATPHLARARQLSTDPAARQELEARLRSLTGSSPQP